MKKHDLIEGVARRTGETEARAAVAVDAVFAAVTEAIAGGDGVTVPGFGSFRVVERAPRNGRNPQTGEAMAIGARRAPVFRPGSRLKEAVAGSDGAAPGANRTDREPGF